MSYFRVCPYCGCHIDPGEICDCDKKETAASAANTDNGKVGFGSDTPFPTSYDNRSVRRIQA